jgi:hypothetical protein
VTVTAADFSWFADRPAGLYEAYCLTLARGLAPAEFLARLGARAERGRKGVGELFGPSMERWGGFPEEGLLIGVTTAPGSGCDWALGVEINGFLGVSEDLIVPLSAGTSVVSHFRNIEAVNRFYWVEDEEIRLYFEPLIPQSRYGSAPDALTDLMRQVGFDLREDGDNSEHSNEAAFALAERLTGVRVTPELLEQAQYQCGIVPVPDGSA